MQVPHRHEKVEPVVILGRRHFELEQTLEMQTLASTPAAEAPHSAALLYTPLLRLQFQRALK